MERTRRHLPGLAAAALLAIAGVAGCSDRVEPAHPVAIIGFDGLEWSVAAPLLREGRMPHLRSLVERGAAGALVTEPPALSPVCWTTIATGKRARQHGITHFLNADGVPFTSNARAGKALWNIASDFGLETLSVGWWVSWPAEEIAGRMVAPYSSAGQDNVNWKGNMYPDVPDQTWPRELFGEIWPIAEDVFARRRELAAKYFDLARQEELSEQERKLVQQTLLSVQADETYVRVASHLLDASRQAGDIPDLTLVYFGGTDVASHRFWRYRTPEEFHYDIPRDAIEILGDTIERFYVEADRMLGEVLARLPEDANVVVCSDHGFRAVALDRPPAEGWSGHHRDGPPGVFVAAGPDVREGSGKALLAGGAVHSLGYTWDVAPLALYLLGVPVGREMEDATGGPLLRAVVKPELLDARRLETADHDRGFRPPSTPIEVSDAATGQYLQWMTELGYLGEGAEGAMPFEGRPGDRGGR